MQKPIGKCPIQWRKLCWSISARSSECFTSLRPMIVCTVCSKFVSHMKTHTHTHTQSLGGSLWSYSFVLSFVRVQYACHNHHYVSPPDMKRAICAMRRSQMNSHNVEGVLMFSVHFYLFFFFLFLLHHQTRRARYAATSSILTFNTDSKYIWSVQDYVFSLNLFPFIHQSATKRAICGDMHRTHI